MSETPGHAPPNVKLYLAIFGALAFLTVVTVLISYWHLPPAAAVAVAMAIATVKAALVAAFFMHLKGERALIYSLLGLTVFFMMVLFTLPISDMSLISDRTTHTPVVTGEAAEHP